MGGWVWCGVKGDWESVGAIVHNRKYSIGRKTIFVVDFDGFMVLAAYNAIVMPHYSEKIWSR